VITESPIGTVKARMFHARQKLRRYLPALGGGASESPANIRMTSDPMCTRCRNTKKSVP